MTSTNTPVKPRHAASLVLYEKRGNNIYLLMGKRAKAHRFLPNVFVFPGGRVDTEDALHDAVAPLPQQTRLALSKPGQMSHAIAAAAVRETYEETGLVIGEEKGGNLKGDFSNLEYVARAITPAHNPIRFNTRFLMQDARHATGELGGSGELLHLQWFSIEEALRMPLVDVTEFVVREVQELLTNTPHRRKEYPLFTYYNGKPLIRRQSL